MAKSAYKDQLEDNSRRLFIIYTVVVIALFVVVITSAIIIKSKSNTPLASSSIEKIFNKEENFVIKKHIIQSGEVFSKLQASLGFTVELTQEILQSAENVYDLAQIKAGNQIQSFFNTDNNEFQKMVYNIDEDSFLLIEKSENDLTAKKMKNEYEIELFQVSGVINDSLYMTGINLGLESKTIMEMADIFAWDIDFGLEVRVGDKFDVLYEKRFLDGKEVSPGKILITRYQSEYNDYWAVYYRDFEGNEDYYDLDGRNLRRQFLRSPVNYKYISSGFTYKRFHPVFKINTVHLAIDYATKSGTPVRASGEGTVMSVGWRKCIGKTIIVRHNDVYETRYSHLSSYAKGIKYGAKVEQGQVIGFVGSTGNCSTGPHLEYGMKKYGQAVNPLLQKFDKAEPIPELYKQDFELFKGELLKLLKQ